MGRQRENVIVLIYIYIYMSTHKIMYISLGLCVWDLKVALEYSIQDHPIPHIARIAEDNFGSTISC